MIKQNKSGLYNCPECDNPLTSEKEIKQGTVVECPACGTESEFITVKPPQLAPLEEEK